MVWSSKTLFIFSVIVFMGENASTTPVKYDQRQEGDLNVRTDVEDVVFVVVPPKDLVSAGMGLVAATAADFLKKNYGPIGPERYPLRSSSKIGFVPLEKSPYKIDLEKPGVQVKKISQPGDPNRYNFHANKNPTKAVAETKPVSTDVTAKPATEIVEKVEEFPSTTESKTVKKDLKAEEQKKEVLEEKKKEKTSLETDSKVEESKTKTDVKKITSITEEPPRVIGELSTNGFDPDSIFRLEGCGPEAYRDSNGKCVYTSQASNPK